MPFKIGDQVSVLDQDIDGVVVAVHPNEIGVKTTFGFLMKFSPKALVLIPVEGLKVTNYEVAKIKHLKQDHKPKPTAVPTKKESVAPKMEVDLHIHQLTKLTGLSNFEMLNLQLETAQRQLDFAMSKRIQKVVFIHGVGAGVLKEELRYLFRRYEGLRHYDADYKKYGMGATEVYISQGAKREA